MELEELSGKIRRMEETIVKDAESVFGKHYAKGTFSTSSVLELCQIHDHLLKIEDNWYIYEEKWPKKEEPEPQKSQWHDPNFPDDLLRKFMKHVLALEPQVCTFRAIQSPVIFSDEEVDYLEEVLSEVLKDLKDSPDV